MNVRATLTILVDEKEESFQVSGQTPGDLMDGLIAGENLVAAVAAQGQRWIGEQEREIRKAGGK